MTAYLNRKYFYSILLLIVSGSSAVAQSGSRNRAGSSSGIQSFSPQIIVNPQPPRPPTEPFFPPSPQHSTPLTQPEAIDSRVPQAALPDSVPIIPSIDFPATNQSDTEGFACDAFKEDLWSIHDPNSTVVLDHGVWSSFLLRYLVTDCEGLNRIKYRQVTKCDQQALSCYVNRLQAIDIRTLNREEQLAFWVNLYNAKTVSVVLKNYPVRSVRLIKENPLDFVGPFNDPLLCVLGQTLTLSDVENTIIRPIWQDPRIHYALNCASFGCPNLSRTAWTSIDINECLDAAAYEFINSGRAFHVTFRRDAIAASNIYKWYAEDFGETDQAILAHLRQYANCRTLEKLSKVKRISRHFYDWSLNDARHRKSRFLEPFRL